MPVPSPEAAPDSAWARSGQNCLAYIARAVAARMSSPLTAARPSGTGIASRFALSTSASYAACGSLPPKLQNDWNTAQAVKNRPIARSKPADCSRRFADGVLM